MGRFVIPVGTSCRVRKRGGGDCVSHVTTRPLTFDTHGVASNGGLWTFVVDGEWDLHVSPRFVIGRDEKQDRTRQQYGTFNKSILGRNGRGASRRRNMRAAKRR